MVIQKGTPMKLNQFAERFQEEMDKLRTKYGVKGEFHDFHWAKGINRHIARKIARKLARKAA